MKPEIREMREMLKNATPSQLMKEIARREKQSSKTATKGSTKTRPVKRLKRKYTRRQPVLSIPTPVVPDVTVVATVSNTQVTNPDTSTVQPDSTVVSSPVDVSVAPVMDAPPVQTDTTELKKQSLSDAITVVLTGKDKMHVKDIAAAVLANGYPTDSAKFVQNVAVTLSNKKNLFENVERGHYRLKV